jgi:hypothetical protein
MNLREFLFFAPLLFTALWVFQYCFRSLLLADWILQELYNHHREIWEKEGSPSGWLWHPPNKLFHIYGGDLLALSSRWESNEPEWLSLDPKIEDRFRRMLRYKTRFYIGLPFVFLVGIATAIVGATTGLP